MRLDKHVLIVFLLLSVFAVGTLNFVDTVEAAKWTKFDSGSYDVKDPEPGFKKKTSYVSYIKGSKNIKMNFYAYPTKNNKKIYIGTMYISKTGKKVKMQFVDLMGDKTKPDYYTTKDSVKKFYKKLANGLKKGTW